VIAAHAPIDDLDDLVANRGRLPGNTVGDREIPIGVGEFLLKNVVGRGGRVPEVPDDLDVDEKVLTYQGVFFVGLMEPPLVVVGPESRPIEVFRSAVERLIRRNAAARQQQDVTVSGRSPLVIADVRL
jgi:hypothetical protein